jgi:hypothetical protein
MLQGDRRFRNQGFHFFLKLFLLPPNETPFAARCFYNQGCSGLKSSPWLIFISAIRAEKIPEPECRNAIDPSVMGVSGQERRLQSNRGRFPCNIC